MKLSFVTIVGALYLSSSAAAAKEDGRKLRSKAQGMPEYVDTPHEIHEYQQVKFIDKKLWKCYMEESTGCMACENTLAQGPNEGNTGALIVDIRAQYKGPSWDASPGRSRTHCVYPGYTWRTCGVTGGVNMVIEPQTEWLSCFTTGDRPQNPNGPSGGSNPFSTKRADCQLDPRQGGCPAGAALDSPVVDDDTAELEN